MISSNLSRDRYILSNYVYEQDSKLFLKFVKISVAKTLSTFLDQPDAIDGQEESLASNTMSIHIKCKFSRWKMLFNVVSQVTAG